MSKHMHLLCLGIVCASIALISAAPVSPKEDEASWIDAVTRAKYDIDLAFDVPGRVLQTHVKLGQTVQAGDVLIELDDRVGAAELEAMKLEIESTISERAQKLQLDLSRYQLGRVTEMHEKGVTSYFELEQAKVTVAIDELKVEKVAFDVTVQKKQYESKQAAHEKFAIRAPVAGMIQRPRLGKEVSVGETVQSQQPVLRLVMVTTLMVDANVPTAQALGVREGDKAWVRSSLPDHDQPVEGTIVHVAKVADPASNTKLVRIEVPNENEYLEAGWQVKVYLTQPALAAEADTNRANNEMSYQERRETP